MTNAQLQKKGTISVPSKRQKTLSYIRKIKGNAHFHFALCARHDAIDNQFVAKSTIVSLVSGFCLQLENITQFIT